jgi:hypothetical protein
LGDWAIAVGVRPLPGGCCGSGFVGCPARRAAISRITAIYPIVYIDALVVKVRDGARVVNRAAHLVVGVDTDG